MKLLGIMALHIHLFFLFNIKELFLKNLHPDLFYTLSCKNEITKSSLTGVVECILKPNYIWP